MKKILQNKRVGIIGFGRLGHLLAPLLQALGAEVHGFRRNPQNISAQGVIKHHLDVSLPVVNLPAMDYWVVTLSPSGRGVDAYYQSYVLGLKNILQALTEHTFQQLFWASSTSIYGQNSGEIINELSEAKPARETGEILLDAENLLQNLPDQSCIVRFSGIYNSRKSRILQQLKAQELSATVEQDYFTNRINEQDAVRVISHLMAMHASGQKLEQLYLASDNLPVKYSDYIAYLSEKTGYALNEDLPAKKTAVGSKRCDNSRLKATGFTFTYPSFKEGLAPLINPEP